MEPENPMKVNLSAGISTATTAVKAGGPYDPGSTEVLDIQLLRRDPDDSFSEPLDATMEAPDPSNSYLRPINFKQPQYFPDKTSEIGFTGWYPAEGDDLSYDPGTRTLTYDIPGDTDMMTGSFVQGNLEDGIETMVFSHALCQYAVSAYAVDEDAAAEWKESYGTISGITVSNLPSRLTAVLPDSPDAQAAFNYGGDNTGYEACGTVDALPVGAANRKEAGTVMGAPACDNAVTVIVSFRNDDGSTRDKEIVFSRNFQTGYRYGLTLRFSHRGIIEAESTVLDWEDTDLNLGLHDGKTYFNLSENGTANCYIVSSANVAYCFDCTVKGNGVNTVSDSNGNTFRLPDTDISLAPDRIEIIRSMAVLEKNGDGFSPVPEAERNEKELMLSLDSAVPREGKVLFSVHGNADSSDFSLKYKGNVLIGAYRGETLLWSWHIWITDRPDTQGYGNGYSSLDRNLGAVDDNPANAAKFGQSDAAAHILTTGFFYQWGRKDPLSRYDIDPDLNKNWQDYQSASAAGISEAHRNPRKIYYSAGSDDWTTDADDHLWGYVNQKDDVRKTLYDPCPPGYRVPDTKVWTESAQYQLRTQTDGGYTYGYVFDMDGNQSIYYPKTDYLGYDDSTGKVKTRTDETDGTYPYIYLNSVRPHICSDFTGEAGTTPGHESLAHHFVFSLKMDDSSDYIPYEKGQAGARANAMPVRCISENAAPATTDLSEVQTANCYMVSRNGYYKFRADMRGNGVSAFNSYINNGYVYVDISGGVNPSININSGCHVDLLWWQGELESGGDYLNFVNGSPNSDEIAARVPLVMVDGGRLDEDGSAYFYVREGMPSYGNAGLALYDENGRILWTWHIWFISNEQNAVLGDYIVMSRNLGATYSPYSADGSFSLPDSNLLETYGFYYQWGRKDPLFGPYKWCRKTGGSWEVVDWSSGADTATATTLSNAMSEPLVFYTSDNQWWQTTYTPGSANIQEARNFWGYVGRQQKGENFVKTMYDPCPPGYRIINHLSFESAYVCHSTGEGWYSLSFIGSDYNSGGIRVDGPDNVSSTFNNRSVEAGMLWLPNSGKMEATGDYSGTGTHGYLNAATPNNAGRQMREFEWELQNNYYSFRQNGQSNHLPARPVRCQKE